MPINLPRFIKFEADIRQYVPYAGHIAPDVVMLTDGSMLAMLHVHGLPFELDEPERRNDRTRALNALLRSLVDPDLTLAIHLVRHDGISPAPQPMTAPGFVRSLMDDIARTTLSRMFRNDWFISVVIHPSTSFTRNWRNWIPSSTPVALTDDPWRRQRLDDVIYMLTTTLTEYGVTRLGTTDVETEIPGESLPVTEIGTALHLIRTAAPITIPHTTGALGAAILTEPVVFGPRAFDLNLPGLERYGAMVGFNNYPASPRVGMFASLLSTSYPLVMTHSFRYLSHGGVMTALDLVRAQMTAAGDRAEDLIKGLGAAMNDTSSARTATGYHHCSFAVYAPTIPQLDLNAADLISRLRRVGGAAPTRERNVWYDGAMEQTYYLQLPGSRVMRPRPARISTRDLAKMASLDNYPVGHGEGYWGASPLRFQTNGRTSYDYVTHDDDVGHTITVGRVGSGKTALLGCVIAALEPVMGVDGIRLVIDKDEGNRLLIEACNGVYRRLARNQESGLAPLAAYADTPRNRAFLHGLYTWCIQRDGRRTLTSLEDARLARGIGRVLSMPAALRSMGAVREFLGYQDSENGAGARFEKYCAGGSMGWLLDNREHLVDIGPGLFGFDFTDLIPRDGADDDGACTAAAAVITHQLGGLMDGRRIAALFDECRFYLEPLKRMIDDYTLTGRKKELMCWLVAQQPEHFTDSPIGMSIVSQARTKIIFPDPSHNPDALRKMQISEGAIRQLREDMTLGRKRRFLLWRPDAPAILEFDLTGLPQLPLLAGRAGTIRLMERIRADNPDATNSDIVEDFIGRTERKAAA